MDNCAIPNCIEPQKSSLQLKNCDLSLKDFLSKQIKFRFEHYKCACSIKQVQCGLRLSFKGIRVHHACMGLVYVHIANSLCILTYLLLGLLGVLSIQGLLVELSSILFLDVQDLSICVRYTYMQGNSIYTTQRTNGCINGYTYLMHVSNWQIYLTDVLTIIC